MLAQRGCAAKSMLATRYSASSQRLAGECSVKSARRNFETATPQLWPGRASVLDGYCGDDY
jgi:hypothetical protein